MCVQDLSITLEAKQSLLIMGQSGCGKSSLLRAICGLWLQGTGTITVPGDSDIFFLPQQPFMPTGTLRDQLLFPSGAAWPNHSRLTGTGALPFRCSMTQCML